MSLCFISWTQRQTYRLKLEAGEENAGEYFQASKAEGRPLLSSRLAFGLSAKPAGGVRGGYGSACPWSGPQTTG